MNEQTRKRAAEQVAKQPKQEYKEFVLDDYLELDDNSFFQLIGETVENLKMKYSNKQARQIAEKLGISVTGINKIWAAIHEKINA